MSSVTVVGYLSGEIELKYTDSGNAVAEFSLGERKSKRDNNGEKVTFIDYRCEAWGRLAENLAASCNKGDRLLMTGEMAMQEWTNREGEARKRLVFRVDDAGPALRFATVMIERNPREEK